jgi:uncharacterized membrane protein YeaQ/YmgE (transglycosylase-associated protein family)
MLTVLATAVVGLLAGMIGAAVRRSHRFGTTTGVGACVLGAAASAALLRSGSVQTLRIAWSPPIHDVALLGRTARYPRLRDGSG